MGRSNSKAARTTRIAASLPARKEQHATTHRLSVVAVVVKVKVVVVADSKKNR